MTRPRPSLLAGVAAAALLGAGVASAHHSTAMFDMQKDVTLDGTIKDFQWTNPHTWIVFVVPNQQGGADQYGIEGMSPNFLVRNGWTKNTLKPGDKVQLVIHPLKDGRKGGFNVSVKFPDGKVMYNLPRRPGS
jgi:Family of unknown function (DUF6152)